MNLLHRFVALIIVTAVCIVLGAIHNKYSAIYAFEKTHARGTIQTVRSQSHDIREPPKEQGGDGDHFQNNIKSSHRDGYSETWSENDNKPWVPLQSPSKNTHSDKGTQPVRPNIVYIMADDMGYNDVGYHNKNVYTPTIDKLSSEGVRLENYYVQPICSPSRIQFMSGRKLIHTGVVHKVLNYNQPYGLPLDSLTLADKLKDAGYNTDMVGKWHLGFHEEEYLPTRRGFDTFYGLYTGQGDHYTHKNVHNGKKRMDLHNDTVKKTNVDYGQDGVYSTHLFTNETIRIIKNRSKEDKPLFLYLSYQAVHDPVQAPSEYGERVVKKITNQTGYKRTQFLGMALAMDDGIARVVESLKENGMWDNTLLIFSTDNGGKMRNGGSNYPLKGEKFTYYEGGVRAVGFVNSPLLKKTGYVNTEMIHITDWFKTFIALANGNLRGTRDVEGFNQWDTISRGTPSPRNEILFNIDPLSKTDIEPPFKHDFDTRVLSASRIGDYKLITGLRTRAGMALFNLKDDPLEKYNLSEKEALRPKLIEMLDALLVHQNTSVPAKWPKFCKIKSWVIQPGVLIQS